MLDSFIFRACDIIIYSNGFSLVIPGLDRLRKTGTVIFKFLLYNNHMRSFFLLRFFRLNSLMALTYSQDTHHPSVEDEFQTGLETSLETHRHGIVRDLEGLSLGRGKGVGSKGKPRGILKRRCLKLFVYLKLTLISKVTNSRVSFLQ